MDTPNPIETSPMAQTASHWPLWSPELTWQRPEIVAAGYPAAFIAELPEREYHTDLTAVARGDVLAALKSPAHVGARRLKPYESSQEKTNLRVGRALHMMLLEPEAFKKAFVVAPVFSGKTKDGRDSTQSKEAREAKAEWFKSIPEGACVVTPEDIVMLAGMARGLSRNKTALALLEGAMCETSVYFRDQDTGLKCRTKPDLINRGLGAIAELKTTAAEGPGEFQKASWGYRYDIQLAMQAQGVYGVTNDLPETLAIIAIEKEPPYCCTVYELERDLCARGLEDYRRAMDLIAKCVETNEWPGREENAKLSIPKWALTNEWKEI